MKQNKKTLQELNLIDNFLLTESMLHEETAETVARLIIERATGLKVEKLIVECQKVINGMDTDRHGIRLDLSISEVNTKDEYARLVRLYDIEVNNSTTVHLPRRSRYYQALTDVKLLETGVDYKALPELWTLWILPYDPFGQNQMIYFVKNVVEGFQKINYNDGIRKVFLYTDGKYGGSPELKALLKYIRNTRKENAIDPELEALHSKMEHLKDNKRIGVRYMHEQEKLEEAIRYKSESLAKEMAAGMAQDMAAGMAQDMAKDFIQGMTEDIRLESLEKGHTQGENQMSRLTALLLEKQEYDELKHAAEEKAYRHQLYAKYGIT